MTKQKALVWYQLKPSESQVSEWEISINSLVRELGIFYVPEKSGDLVLI